MTVRYLLDSDICIYLMKHRPAAILRRLGKLSPGNAGVSVIAFGELCLGTEQSRDPESARANLDTLTEIAPVRLLPANAVGEYARIRHHLATAGRLIGGNDLWIAAHALAEEAVLVTSNEREFRRVPGLRMQNWIR